MKLRGITLPSMMAAALLLMLPSASRAASISLTNPGFETETGSGCSTSHPGNCTPTGWSLSGYAYVVHSPTYASSNYAIQLTGYPPNGGSVTQNVNLGAGSYTLTFYLDTVDAPSSTLFWADWDGQQIGATIDGAGSTVNTGFELETINFNVTAGTAGTHGLSLNDDWIQGDFYVDNVALTMNTTPEPGSLVLFGSGMLGLAGLLRRKVFKA